MSSKASCQFCSKPDDSIQVVCESRCLLCSRCQFVPAIRRLLLDHTIFQTSPSLSEESIRRTSANPSLPSGPTVASGKCPICLSSLSPSMLALIETFQEVNQTLDDKTTGNFAANSSSRLEEVSHGIVQFLKRFRLTYDSTSTEAKPYLATASNNVVDIDAEIEDMLLNGKRSIYPTSNNTPTTLAGKTNKNQALEKEAVPAAAKVNITTALEFIIDCYHAQWQSIVKNGNDSMLSIMMKQSNRKKFSQKTNDYKTKGLIDFLLSGYGYEMPELILFCHLIGLQPKFTPKISAAWSHISATALVAICYYDACVKSEELYNEQTTSAAGMNELKTRLLKCFHMISLTNNNANNPAINQLNSNNSKVMSVKKALTIIEFLQSIRQPYWIMAPLMATCVEYESRLAWTEESLSKLINIVLYVSLYLSYLSKQGQNIFPVITESYLSALPRQQREVNSSINASSSFHDVTALQASITGTNPTFTTNPEVEEVTTAFARRLAMKSGIDPAQAKPQSFSARKTSFATASSFSVNTNRSDNVSGTNNTSAPPGTAPKIPPKPSSRTELFRFLHPLIDHLWVHCDRKYSIGRKKLNSKTFNSQITDYLSDLHQQLFVRKESCYVHLTLKETINFLDNSPLMIPICDFLYILILCWEREYRLIQQSLEKSKILKLRRTAITANVTGILQHCEEQRQAQFGVPSQVFVDPVATDSGTILPPMTAGEKQALTKLLYFYRNQETKEFLGIDWDEFEDKHLQAFYPFSIPRSLLHKSRIELNLLCQHLIKVIRERIVKEENEILVQHNHHITEVMLDYHSHKTAQRNLLKTEDIRKLEENGELIKSGYEDANDFADSNSVDTILTPPTLPLLEQNILRNKGNNLLMEVNKRYLANHSPTLAVISSSATSLFAPKRNLSMTGTYIPSGFQIGEHLPMVQQHEDYQLMKDKFTAGGFSSSTLSPQKGYNSSNSVQIPNLGRNSTGKERILTLADQIDNHHSALREIKGSSIPKNSLIAQHFSSQVSPKRKGRAAISGKLNRGLTASSQIREGIVKEEDDTILDECRDEEEDEGYYQKINQYRKQRIMSTRTRILSRYEVNQLKKDKSMIIDLKTTFHIEESNPHHSKILEGNKTEEEESAKAPFEKTKSIRFKELPDHPEEYLPGTKQKDILSWKSRIIPYLQLRHSLNAQGDMTVNLSNSLISESSVRYLSMKDGKCSLQAFEVMLSTYCKPWQMEYMKVLDVSNNPRVGSKGAELLGGALRGKCRLIHVNLNGCKIGDAGLRHVLQGMIDGGGEGELLRLDLQSNDITIATPGFALLSQFHELKFLDVSKNLFTLENKGRNGNESHRSQWDTFYTAIYALVHNKLEYLSLAYNKIQDEGFSKIVNEIILTKDSIYYYLPLKVLDVAYCFLTNKSKYLIELLIVNSMQRENDGNVYKKAYEYTERHLWTHEYQKLAENIQNQLQSAGNHVMTTEKDPKKMQKRLRRLSSEYSFHAAHKSSVHAVLPNRSNLTDQKISKVFIKPEMIPIIANAGRNRRKELGFIDSPEAETQNDVDGDGFIATVANSMQQTYENMPEGKAPPSPTSLLQQKKKRSQSKSSLRDSFTEHLNSIVHGHENIILILNHLKQDNNYFYSDVIIQEYYLHLNSYYILSNLQMLLLHGNIFTQNIWEEIINYQEKATIKLFYLPTNELKYQKLKRRKYSQKHHPVLRNLPGSNYYNSYYDNNNDDEQEEDSSHYQIQNHRPSMMMPMGFNMDDTEDDNSVFSRDYDLDHDGGSEDREGDYGQGISDTQVYELKDYDIDLHPSELNAL